MPGGLLSPDILDFDLMYSKRGGSDDCCKNITAPEKVLCGDTGEIKTALLNVV